MSLFNKNWIMNYDLNHKPLLFGYRDLPSPSSGVDLGEYKIGAFIYEANVRIDIGVELRCTVPRDAFHADRAAAAASFLYYLHSVVINLKFKMIFSWFRIVKSL